MTMKDSSGNGEIVRRLNAIIALLVLSSNSTQREILVGLSNAGLRPFEIANILGRLPHTVRAELSKKRKTSQT
jgi:DNA-binding CsgD family transcriptional regulator